MVIIPGNYNKMRAIKFTGDRCSLPVRARLISRNSQRRYFIPMHFTLHSHGWSCFFLSRSKNFSSMLPLRESCPAGCFHFIRKSQRMVLHWARSAETLWRCLRGQKVMSSLRKKGKEKEKVDESNSFERVGTIGIIVGISYSLRACRRDTRECN